MVVRPPRFACANGGHGAALRAPWPDVGGCHGPSRGGAAGINMIVVMLDIGTMSHDIGHQWSEDKNRMIQMDLRKNDARFTHEQPRQSIQTWISLATTVSR